LNAPDFSGSSVPSGSWAKSSPSDTPQQPSTKNKQTPA